jgi:hypothetical protein
MTDKLTITMAVDAIERALEELKMLLDQGKVESAKYLRLDGSAVDTFEELEKLQTAFKRNSTEQGSAEQLRTAAFWKFLDTGDLTELAPTGRFEKTDPLRAIFAPYVFCTISKVRGRTIYYTHASDRNDTPRSGVLGPNIHAIIEGPCVIYNDKAITQHWHLNKEVWKERGYAFNSLFRA